MKGRKKSILVLLLVFISGILPVFAQQLDPEIAFAKAFDLFRQGNYRDASQAFGSLYSETSMLGGKLAEQAAYMNMISTFNAGRYADAKLLSEEFLSRFSDSEHSADVQYQLARIAYAEKRYEDAISMFSDFVSQHEDNLELRELVSQAVFWRAESYYQQGMLIEAYSEFSVLSEKYPETIKMNEALQRIELISAALRERFQGRVMEFIAKETTQKQIRTEQAEKYAEQILERYAILVRRLRSMYGITQSPGKLPLYANLLAIPVPPAPVITIEQSQPKNQVSNLDAVRNNRLKKLLSAKQRVLSLLAEKLLNYAGEVLK